MILPPPLLVILSYLIFLPLAALHISVGEAIARPTISSQKQRIGRAGPVTSRSREMPTRWPSRIKGGTKINMHVKKWKNESERNGECGLPSQSNKTSKQKLLHCNLRSIRTSVRRSDMAACLCDTFLIRSCYPHIIFNTLSSVALVIQVL